MESSSVGEVCAGSEAAKKTAEVQCIQDQQFNATSSSQDGLVDDKEWAITQRCSSVFLVEVHQCRLCTSFSSTQKKKLIKHIKKEHATEFQILKDTEESPSPKRGSAENLLYQAHLEEILEKGLATENARRSNAAASLEAVASRQGVIRVYNVKPRVLCPPPRDSVNSGAAKQVPAVTLGQKTMGQPKSTPNTEEGVSIGTQEKHISEEEPSTKEPDTQPNNRLRPVLGRKAKAKVREFQDYVRSDPQEKPLHAEDSGEGEEDENDVDKDKVDSVYIPDETVATEKLDSQGVEEHHSTVPREQTHEALQLQNDHSVKKQFKCSVCHFMYRTGDALKRHIKLKRCIGVPITSKEFPCRNCDYKASSAAGLKIHLHSHQQRADRKYRCASCKKGFTSIKGVRKHIRSRCPVLKTKIPKVPKTYPCEQCGRVFKDRKGVGEHMATHTLVRNFKCDLCTKTFKTVGALRRHRNKHEDKFFYCDQCSFKTKWGSSLKTHFTAHHAEDSREFLQCPHCPHQTKNKYYFKRHLESHSDSRMFICEICGKGFKSRPNLYAHKERHKDGSYPCSECDYIGKTKMAMYSHQLVHLPREKMNYKCEQCSWVGKRKSELRMHYRKHSSEKLYQCNECEKSYKHKHGLTRHLAEKHLGKSVDMSSLEMEGMGATEEHDAAVLSTVQEMMHSAHMSLDVIDQSEALNGVPAIIQAAEMHDRELRVQQYQLIQVHDAQGVQHDEQTHQDDQLSPNVAITSVPVAQIFEISTSNDSGRGGHIRSVRSGVDSHS